MIRQSPKHLRHPSAGSDPEDLPDDRTGGNKHSTTGGATREFAAAPGPVERSAAATAGIESPPHPSPSDGDFPEDGPGPERVSGSTLTKAGIS